MSQASSVSLVDLSHTVQDGLLTYMGLPAPVISDFLSRTDSRQHYSLGTEFHIGKIEMVANTGTYLDAPFHRFAEGKDLSELPLQSLANLPGIRVTTSHPSIDLEVFKDMDFAGKAVLVHTGWSRHWGTKQYFEGHPFLTRKAAEFLVAGQAALVGIDSMNIDDIKDGTRPVHTMLLRESILVVEHLTNLAAIPADGFRFFAVPVKVKSFGSFPVRAFAIS